MANVPFANAPQSSATISDDFLLPIQVGHETDESGLPQMKYIKFSKLNEYVRRNLSTLGRFRGAYSSNIPDTPAVNDYFVATATFTVGTSTFTTGHYYQYDTNEDWVDISVALSGLLSDADIIDNLLTQATDKVLSANMGYELHQEIQNILPRGRYLSLWNCTTGLPETNPPTIPYAYRAGDYYIVSVVGATNYRPNGSSYAGTASTTVDASDVYVDDFYEYDGVSWLLLHNVRKEVQFSQIAGNPRDNLALASDLADSVHHANDIPATAVPVNADQLNGHSDTYFVPKSDIVDNLTSTVTNQPLSAKQGKVLNDAISDINTSIGISTTEETIAGTYDGRTLYKRTFAKGSDDNGNPISMGPVNATYSNIRGLEGFHILSDYIIPLAYDNQSGKFFKTYIRTSDMKIVVENSGYGAFTSYITVYYVK